MQASLLEGKRGFIIQGDYVSANLLADVLQLEGCDVHIFLHHIKTDVLLQLEKQEELDLLIINSKGVTFIEPFLDKFPNLAIILLTAEDKDNIAADNRISKILTKPFDIEKISGEIARTLVEVSR